MTNSEHELEFTFANYHQNNNKTVIIIIIVVIITTPRLSLQLFINVTTKNASLSVEDRTSNTTLTLRGFNADEFHKYPTSTQYQPVLVANHTYRLKWNNSSMTPTNINLSIYNFPQ